MRNAASLDGEADTRAAIAGSVAEAIHGIPNELKARVANRYLTGKLDRLEAIEKLYRFIETVMRKAVDPETGQEYLIEMPGPEPVK